MFAAGLQLPASLATMSDGPESSTKKRRGFGRPADALIWNLFDRIELPPEKAKTTKRNYDAKHRHCTETIR